MLLMQAPATNVTVDAIPANLTVASSERNDVHVADRVTDLEKLALECQWHHSNACDN